jgi:hypothetical protein
MNSQSPVNDYTECPSCGSSNSRVSLTEFRARWGWQPLGNRICGECGTAWRPQCPRWAAAVSIVVGCVMWAGALALVGLAAHEQGLSNFIDSIVQNESPEVGKATLLFATFILLALWPFLYGMAVLRGRAGKLEILGKVLPTSSVPEISETGSRPLPARVCAGCRQPIPPGSAFCPHCGLRQSSNPMCL